MSLLARVWVCVSNSPDRSANRKRISIVVVFWKLLIGRVRISLMNLEFSAYRNSQVFFFCLGLLYTERLGKSRNKEVHWDLRERSPRDFTGGKEWVQRGPKILTGKAKSTVILFRSIKLFSLSFLLHRLPLQNFGKCDKFTSFAQCSKRNKRNLQIEIPGKVREEGQYLFSTPLNYYTFYYLVPARAHHSYRKTLFQPHLTHFLIFGIFYYDRLNSDDFIT